VTKPFDKLRAGSFDKLRAGFLDRLRISFQLRVHPPGFTSRFLSRLWCTGGRMPPHRHAGMRALRALPALRA